MMEPKATSEGERADRGERHRVVVSGGGSAASLPLYRSATEAAAIGPNRHWRILVGRGVAEEDFAALCDQAPGNVAVERGRPDFRAL
jgi:predicted glycosyltransferase